MNNESRPMTGEVYQHYKGNLYQVVAIAKHTERADEDLVIYSDVNDETKVWARPLAIFQGCASLGDGQVGYRFSLL